MSNLGWLARTSVVATLAASSFLLIACGGQPTCQDRGNCATAAPSGGSSGNAASGAGGVSGNGNPGGTSGASGQSATGGEAGVSGTAGVGGQAGTSGSAGTGGSAGADAGLPCDGQCSGATPVCDASANTCVECLAKSDCAGSKPACDTTTSTCVACTADDAAACEANQQVCDTSTDTCVECVGNSDCMGSTPFCDTAANTCVACLQQSDCKDAAASLCVAGACKPCAVNADCSNIAGKGVCNSGTCVQCTGKDFAACGSSMSTPLVCDSLLHTCTQTKQASAGLCQSCVSDAQCNAGQICVQEQYGSPAKSVGYFCFWKKGDTADGAPALCSSARPYVTTLTNAVSIDGSMSDICSLRVSSCVAKNEFSSKDCTKVAAPDDSVCGVSPPNDAKCAQFDVGVYRCTLTCGSDDDCPVGFPCNTGASPQVCAL